MNASALSCAHCGATNPPQATACSSCGELLDTRSKQVNSVLVSDRLLKGRYRLLKAAGTGGFGIVYQAEDTQAKNQIVAIKTITQSSLKPEELQEATEAFQREAYLLAGLNHPNLPHIYDSFREAGGWYLVMEFINGETLEERLNTLPANRLPVHDALQIGLQLATVLDYLHTHQPPIIFRDLKPANVMLTASGHIYLIDFGIARLFKPGQTKDTILIGTPGYLAPEGYGKTQTTPRSDLYSLGATLHHLLSGIDPTQQPFRYAPLAIENPARLAPLIAQMVQMDEHSRPASAREVSRALQQMLDEAASDATATTASPRSSARIDALEAKRYTSQRERALERPREATPARVFSRRNVIIGLAGLPIVAGGLGLFMLSRQRVTPPAARIPADPTTQPTNIPTLPADLGTQVYLNYTDHPGEVYTVGWSYDGKYLASGGEQSAAHVWNATNGQLIFSPATSPAVIVHKLAWSPTGLRIASTSNDSLVRVWDALNGRSPLARPLISSYAGGLAWSPDGVYIASGDSESGLYGTPSGYTGDRTSLQIWNATTGTTRSIYSTPDDGFTDLAWSPDGQRIASAGYFSTYTLKVWEIATQAVDFTYHDPEGSIVQAVAWSPDGQRLASASNTGYIIIWNIQSASKLLTFEGHEASIHAIAWSPDGTRLATVSDDATVKLWKTDTGENVFVYHGHAHSSVNAVAWSPDGSRIASAGFRSVQVWQPK